MTVFFLAQKNTILIPNAENKDRSGALWLWKLNLSFFYREKKDSHYGNQSTAIVITSHLRPCKVVSQVQRLSINSDIQLTTAVKQTRLFWRSHVDTSRVIGARFNLHGQLTTALLPFKLLLRPHKDIPRVIGARLTLMDSSLLPYCSSVFYLGRTRILLE